MRNHKLEKMLLDYIKDHESDNVDITDLVVAFPKYNIDTLITTLGHLRVNKQLWRVVIGTYYKYTTIKPKEE